jgi:hypothetical protein
MEELVKVFPYLAQLPLVALVLWINRQHKRDMDEQRERYIAYMAKRDEASSKAQQQRDERFLAALAQHSITNREMSVEIKALAMVITRLEVLLQK